eukprot:1348899-Rhodomonas_salina.1
MPRPTQSSLARNSLAARTRRFSTVPACSSPSLRCLLALVRATACPALTSRLAPRRLPPPALCDVWD